MVSRKKIYIVSISVVVAILAVALLVFVWPKTGPAPEDYAQYRHPASMDDTPPGFGGWGTTAQCDWQLRYFPDVLDGYCGEFPHTDGQCDDMCQAIVYGEG